MSGRGTAGGIVFQGEVGARVAGLLLSERPLSRIAPRVPGYPRRVLFETLTAVDDLLIETDLGEVYIQAKRTLSLSKRVDSELASVADQFVRQFLAGSMKGRDLEPDRDRLVLAVGDNTGAPVANHLRQVLDRTRTGAATGLPKNLAKAQGVFKEHLEREWLKHQGIAIGDDNLACLLAVCSVAVVGDAQRQIVEEACLDIVAAPGEVNTLVELLDIWGARASANGVGGDEAAIRLSLGDKISLKAPPSYQADIGCLDRHTDTVLRRLSRFTTLAAPEGPVKLERAVVPVIAKAAREASFVVTGDPGAGKSAVLYEVAGALRCVGPVVTLSVEATAISLDALRIDIGLGHPVTEVLERMPGQRPAFLILDALDAARGGLSESTYKQLIEYVVAELPGWHVVASVRTFDLRLGREWKRLFAGQPVDPAYEEPTLSNIRHAHVPLLTSGEIGQLDDKTPSLASAIAAAGAKVAALARNLFNLALIGDLLCAGASAGAFAKISTRGDLLERFWSERIDYLGLKSKAALAWAVKQMLSNHAVDLAEATVDISVASALEEFLRAGILVTEPSCRIGFRHHVLFDYAVACLVLSSDREDVLSLFKRSNGVGLLISASIGYWLEHVKASETPEAFWALVGMLMTNPDIDPIIRVESARLAVEGVGNEERLDAILANIQEEEEGQGLLSQLSGALLTMKLRGQQISPTPWADLLGRLYAPRREQIGSVLAMLNLLIERDSLCESDRAAIGKAARVVFDAMGDDPQLVAWRARVVVPLVARTYGTHPTASRVRLSRIFEPERFRAFGHLEMPSLASRVADMAEHDSDFAVQVFHRTFLEGDFSAEQETTLSGSWILGLTSNARQDFEGARHELGRAFPSLLAEDPETALRAFGATLGALCETERGVEEEQATVKISYRLRELSFTPDHSAIWAWNIDEARNPDNQAHIFRAFLDWASGPAKPDVLSQAPDLVLGEATSALAWRALFQAGASRPAELGVLLWHSASAEPILKCMDTCKNAIDLIAATHSYVSQDDRRALEEMLFRFDFSYSSAPLRRQMRLLGTLFDSIGEARLETEVARALLARGRAEGLTFENRKAYDLGPRTNRVRDRLEDEVVETQAVATPPLLKAVKSLTAASTALESSASSETRAGICRAIEELEESLLKIGEVDHVLESQAGDALAAGLGLALRSDSISVDRTAAIERLLDLTRSPDPRSDNDTEEQFANSASWCSPSTRVRVAQELAELASYETWSLIGPRVEELIREDPHPAVRFKLMNALPRVAAFDIESMWRLVERCVEVEQNSNVLAGLFEALTPLLPEHNERLEPFVLRVAEGSQGSDSRLSDSLTHMLVLFVTEHGLEASEYRLHEWTADYLREESRLTLVLRTLRRYMVIQTCEVERRAKARCAELICRLIDTLEPPLQSWIGRGGAAVQPKPAELSALRLLRAVGEQLYYAVGPGDELPGWLEGVEAKRAFLSDQKALISRLSKLGDPSTVHHMMHIIDKLTEGNPTRCFDLFSDAMLRTTGVAHYEYESLGTTKFVEMVSRYLADFRSLFEEPVRRRKLMDCIAVFVDAGWPEARSLFQSLPELVQ